MEATVVRYGTACRDVHYIQIMFALSVWTSTNSRA